MGLSSLSCYLCAAGLFVASVDEVVSLWSESHRREAMLKTGAAATAAVWGHHEEKRRRLDFVPDYYVDVRYRLNNRTQRASARATHAMYEQSVNQKQVTIKYQADRPGDVVVAGDTDPFGARYVQTAGIAFAAMGLVVLGRRAAYSGF